MQVPQTQLQFTIDLGTGSYGGSTPQTVTISNVRARARINKVGTPAFNKAQVKIFGLPLDMMNQLSQIGVQPDAFRNNTVTVSAGLTGGTPSLAFKGGIRYCWPEFSDNGESWLNIIADTGALAQMQPVAPSSYNGSTDVATIMQSLAKQMNLKFENNGVSVQLSNPYLPGTARAQAVEAAEAADIYVVFDDDQILAILPKNGSRSGTAPVLDPVQGTLVGYPSYVGPAKIGLKSPYNPQLRFMGNVQVQNSVISGANGTWRINTLIHDLSSQDPVGPWFSEIVANLLNGND